VEVNVPRPLWKGSISFGLVNVPIELYTAENQRRPAFRQLYRKTMAPVREQRIDEQSGDVVAWEDVVKGFQLSDGRFVVIGEGELEAANPKATHTIDILAFVERGQIEAGYFMRPYYVAPSAAGRKGYALLREALRRTGRVGIARIVLRSKQYLAALVPDEDVMVLELLRFAAELRDPGALDVPTESLKELNVSDREVELAEQLITAMAESWDPSKYHDEYTDEVMDLIERKAASPESVAAAPPPAQEEPGQVVDIMELLRRSVEQSKGEGESEEKGGGNGDRKKPRSRRKTA
jgi:DNA end-binding protein Ku